MNRKKIRERLDSLDLRSFFLTISFFMIAIFLFFFFTGIRDGIRSNAEEKLEGHTRGEIVSVEPYNRISQSKWKGTEMFVDSYKIRYRYNVNGDVFEGVDIIPVTTKNQKLLNQILKNNLQSICLVKFDVEDPKTSILAENQ